MIDLTGRFGNDVTVIWLGLLANATLWGIIAIGAAYLACRLGQKWLKPSIRAWIWRLAMMKVLLSLVPLTPLSLSLLPPQPVASISPDTFTKSE
ncbi:hypothetical protein EON80_01585, partial [bacterium]